MKLIYMLPSLTFIGLALAGCSRKYQDYSFIQKREFVQNENRTHAARPPKMMAGKKETEQFCQGQILFDKNANEIAEASVPALVSQSCPGSDYLLDARITRLWWTTLLYTRSCVTVESYCPKR